ncbi:MAG TPA: response regulator [Rhizomicrobium sp.]|nr:response regulator [Rhizomicrobium sp.]
MSGYLSATVLVVEDEALVRMLIVDELQRAGLTVLEAENGTRGLEQALNAPAIDLVLTDVKMPGPMDGLALAREIRSTMPRVKIIVMSGQTGNWEANAVADAFVSKPFECSELVSVVKRLLRECPQSCATATVSPVSLGR